jgi:pilus assembly protein CpaF
VTTIALEGVERASVRCGHGDLTGIGRLFEDPAHLARTIARLLFDAGAELDPAQAVVETGLIIEGRRVRMSVVAPPLTPTIHADIRLHPRRAPSLDDLAAADFISAEAADLLRQITRSSYGFVIAGESESGKTTLLGALARELPEPRTAITAVQRVDELALPDEVQRRWVQWPTRERVGMTFGEQVLEALEAEPRCLLLDEVRADSPEAVAPLLEAEQTPRQIWVVRAAPDHKRLQSALGMLARRASVGQGELLVHALYERLPFVITVARIGGRLQLFSVAEWQSRIDTDYPDYVMLMHYQDGAARRTDKTLARWLDSDAQESASN